LGDTFTVADAYLFVMTNWANSLHVDLTSWSNVGAFRARVLARPKVQEAMKTEGLIK
jgi:glutathione S-transferase